MRYLVKHFACCYNSFHMLIFSRAFYFFCCCFIPFSYHEFMDLTQIHCPLNRCSSLSQMSSFCMSMCKRSMCRRGQSLNRNSCDGIGCIYVFLWSSFPLSLTRLTQHCIPNIEPLSFHLPPWQTASCKQGWFVWVFIPCHLHNISRLHTKKSLWKNPSSQQVLPIKLFWELYSASLA